MVYEEIIESAIAEAELEAKLEAEKLRRKQVKLARRKVSKERTVAMKKLREHKNLRRRDFWVVSKYTKTTQLFEKLGLNK